MGKISCGKQTSHRTAGFGYWREGRGIPKLLKEKCDFLISIPMKGKISSLNASAAASIFLFEVLRQRSKMGV